MKKILIVVGITLFCSVGAFYVFKSGNPMLHDAEYLQLFTGYKSKHSFDNSIDSMEEFGNYATSSYSAQELKSIRPQVFGATLVAFVLALILVRKKKPEKKKTDGSPLVHNESIPRIYEEKIIREKGKTVNGKREGVWDFFDENGEFIGTKTYENGNEISSDEK